jgi:hypothetical protein
MQIQVLAGFLMPTKIKIILFILLFVILPALIFHSAGIGVAWLFGGLILIPLAGYVNPATYIIFVIEAYVIACLIANYFSPLQPKSRQKPVNLYQAQVRRKTN